MAAGRKSTGKKTAGKRKPAGGNKTAGRGRTTRSGAGAPPRPGWLATILDSITEGVFTVDRDWNITYFNRAAEEITGIERGEALGRKCFEVHGCADGTSQICPVLHATLSAEPKTSICERTDSSGLWHCYQQVCTPVNRGGTRLVVLTFDITEQRRQTEQMRLINKLAGMVETSLDLDRVLHLALTCLTAGHAIGFNRAFVFLLDEERRHLVGKMAVGPASAAEARRKAHTFMASRQALRRRARGTPSTPALSSTFMLPFAGISYSHGYESANYELG